MLDRIIQSESDKIKEVFHKNGIKDPYKHEKGIIASIDCLDSFLKDEMVVGNLHKIMDLFNGVSVDGIAGPMLNLFSERLGKDLSSKVHLDPDLAKSVSGDIAKIVMDKFASGETGRAESETDIIKILHVNHDSSMSGMLENVASKTGKTIHKGIGDLYKK